MNKKFQQLQERVRSLACDGVALAFSGGVDSALLLVLFNNALTEVEKSSKLLAVTCRNFLQNDNDMSWAQKLTRHYQVPWLEVAVNPLDVDAELVNNPPERCYLCKKVVFSSLLKEADKRNLTWLVDGTNYDDLFVHRPGLRAKNELGVISPLAELEITKEEVRQWAAELKIPVANRASSPCLATRLPYNTRIELETLQRIGAMEEFLRTLDLHNVRCRLHGEVARIEVDLDSLTEVVKQAELITAEAKKLKFRYITLDLAGFRSGSMDL